MNFVTFAFILTNLFAPTAPQPLTKAEMASIYGGWASIRCDKCVCNSDLTHCECTNCTITAEPTED